LRHHFACFTRPTRRTLSQLRTLHRKDGQNLSDVETADTITLVARCTHRNRRRVLVHYQNTAYACVQTHVNGVSVTLETATLTPQVPEIAFHIPGALRLHNTRPRARQIEASLLSMCPSPVPSKDKTHVWTVSFCTHTDLLHEIGQVRPDTGAVASPALGHIKAMRDMCVRFLGCVLLCTLA